MSAHGSYLIDFERLTVNCIRVREGKGTTESPVRIVAYYMHDDGSELTRIDPVEDDGLVDR